MIGQFDGEERDAILYGDDITAEVRSQDSQPYVADCNGYSRENNFVVNDDDDDRDSLSSEGNDSTDDDTCSECSDDDDEPRDSTTERKLRMALIDEHRTSMIKKAKGQHPFYYTAHESAIPALCIPDARVKRPTSRSTLINLIINSWLAGDIRRLDMMQVSEFMRLVKTHKTEHV
jgi:hypothetical protein